MTREEYKIIKDCFFKSYKSFVDFIMITNDKHKKYSILILKDKSQNNLSKVSIIIRENQDNIDTLKEYSNNVILTHEEADNLINDIREDFIDNHYISYSAINTRSLIQTLENTIFSLNIKLNNKEEYEEAITLNSKINTDSKRHKVLSKN